MLLSFYWKLLNCVLLWLKFPCPQPGEKFPTSAKTDPRWVLHGWDPALGLRLYPSAHCKDLIFCSPSPFNSAVYSCFEVCSYSNAFHLPVITLTEDGHASYFMQILEQFVSLVWVVDCERSRLYNWIISELPLAMTHHVTLELCTFISIRNPKLSWLSSLAQKRLF